MDRNDVAAAITDCLADIAPEIDVTGVDPDTDLIDGADLDSMDFLNLMAALDERVSVAVPERDYPQVRTLNGMIAYLAARV